MAIRDYVLRKLTHPVIGSVTGMALGAAVMIGLVGGIEYLGSSPEIQPPYPQKLEERISRERTLTSQNEAERYATIIMHSEDQLALPTAYDIFMSMGFKQENIYVLTKKGQNLYRNRSIGVTEERQSLPVDDIASKDAINLLFTHLSTRLDEKDLLFVFLSGHGGRTKYNSTNRDEEVEISTITIPGPDLTEVELKTLLDKIKSKATIVMADACFGGGFANRLSDGTFVGISSSKEDEAAHGFGLVSFGMYFLDAYRHVPQSDINSDGKVSINEAFNYARERHLFTGVDTPILKSKLDLESMMLQ